VRRILLAACTAALLVACGGGDGSSSGSGGSAGAGGGSAGTAGASGAAGADAGVGGSAGATGGTGGTVGDAGSDAPVGPPPYDVHANDRQGCTYGPGDLTTTTIGPNVPHGDTKLPFDHIVVLMMENRSFDQYFSKLPDYGVTDVDVATGQDFNYDPDTNPPSKIFQYHESRYCILDTDHEWTAVHLQYDNGLMDGFVATNNPGGARAMGYYDDTDIPYYYWLAKTFAISDRNFSSLLGPTWPNRFYLYGATSWGNTKTSDGTVFVNQAYRTAPKIMDLLDQAGRTWKIYRDHISFASIFKPTDTKYYGSSMSTFDSDVDNDTLPDVAFVDPTLLGTGGTENDEHPPSNIQLGQKFTARVLDKLMSNPAVWDNTVFFLMYDEHGGLYDHVPPPKACEPDNYVPPDFHFDRLGVRTPLVVASAWVRPGYVSHLVTDHTSVTRFIENRFDLPAMTNRDANAWPLLDMFDFNQMSFPTAPSGAPAATVDPAGEQYCSSNPTGGTGMP
jgi:phospholipase C